MHSEELHDLYSSPNSRVMKKNEMGWACSANGGGSGPYRVWVGKSEGRSLGKPRCRWENNVKVDFKEIGWEDV